MATGRKKAKQASGGARLLASGKKPVTLGLLPDDYELFKAGAAKERLPLTQYIIYHMRKTSKKITEST